MLHHACDLARSTKYSARSFCPRLIPPLISQNVYEKYIGRRICLNQSFVINDCTTTVWKLIKSEHFDYFLPVWPLNDLGATLTWPLFYVYVLCLWFKTVSPSIWQTFETHKQIIDIVIYNFHYLLALPVNILTFRGQWPLEVIRGQIQSTSTSKNDPWDMFYKW